LTGKPKDGPLVQELVAQRYAELQKESPEITKAEGARIIADEMGKKPISVRRYLADAAPPPEILEAPKPPPPPDEVWKAAEVLNEREIERKESRGKATYRIHDSAPFGLLLSSDEHLDNSGCDLATLRDMAQLVSVTDGLYAGLHGDLRDNFIIRKLMSAQLGSSHHPKDQLRLVDYYLSMFGVGKILYMVAGNHDNWEESLSGVDTLESLAAKHRILYDSDQFTIDMKCGHVDYTLFIRHKGRFNSSYNDTHGPKQWLRMSIAPSRTDLLIGGHHHTPAIEYWMWNDRRRLAIKTGSAKRGDEFAHKVGFPPGGFMAPVVIFWPDQRKMLAFPDYREGAEYLTYLRSL